MRILRPGCDLRKWAGRVVAYSSFDGLHLGHQHLMARMSDLPLECRVALLDETGVQSVRLSSRRRCVDELTAWGFACLLIRTARLDLGAALNALRPTEILRPVGEPCPAVVNEFPVVRMVSGPDLDGAPITSQRLRATVSAGALDEAEKMLGSPYLVEGRVLHGHHRGAAIGVPTANLHVRALQLPPDGVYAVTVRTMSFRGVGVANLGSVPTFGNAARSLETHIFDFDGDLYGCRLSVGFVERLRGERKFDGIDALVVQIRRDIEAARAVHERRCAVNK